MKVNIVLSVSAILICAITGVRFSVFGFDALNIVSTELVLVPSMLFLMGLSYEKSSRVSMLMKTAVSVVVIVLLVSNVIMGCLDAGAAGYIIVDGFLLVGMSVGCYLLTRINQ